MGYRLLPHTADLRAVLEAPDRASLYQAAVDLVREVVAGDSPVAGAEERAVEPSGGDERERFFRFVRELVYLYDAEGFLPRAVAADGGPLRVRGERFDPRRHHSERQLKAVTRHGLRLEEDGGGLRAELVFDL
jgi:SHS2 domain-containing protein